MAEPVSTRKRHEAPGPEADGGEASPPVGIAWLVVAVAAGYYLGARLGFVLRFPPATTSVIWPPNACLTAVLVLTPPRRWWVCILAVLPAHILVEAQAGFPPGLIAALFATNCLEAILAAGALHLWSDQPARFNTLRRITVFVAGAVFLAPLASSFPDAAAVAWLQGEPYRLVWLRRVLSNTLSQLTLVPALVLAVGSGAKWLRESSARSRIEAALLTLGLASVSGIVFSGYQGQSAFLPGGPYTSLPFLMPLLILAAVRFGPGGASLSLLATALLAIGTAMSGWTPLTVLPVEERVVALQVFLIVVGVPLLVLSALIEERRQTETALAESEGRLRLIADAMPVLIAYVDAGRRCGFSNAASERWFRQAPKDLHGRLIDEILPGDVLAAVREPVERALRGSAEHLEFETRAPNGDVRRIAATLVPHADAGGAVRGFYALAQDITARAHTEESLRRQQEALAHNSRILTLGELAAALAHELTQPLTAILSNAQATLRLRGSGSTTPDEVDAILQDIAKDAARGGEIIRRLRELARRGEANVGHLDLHRAIQGIEPLLRAAALEDDVTLHLDLSPDLPSLRGDTVQFQQVILNLARNGMEATRAVPRGKRAVAISALRTGATAVIEVKDSGPPLDEAVVGRLFEPFYTTKSSGLGMGLAISRSIIEAHGGRIAAHRNLEGGLTVRITLPPPKRTQAQVSI